MIPFTLTINSHHHSLKRLPLIPSTLTTHSLHSHHSFPPLSPLIPSTLATHSLHSRHSFPPLSPLIPSTRRLSVPLAVTWQGCAVLAHFIPSNGWPESNSKSLNSALGNQNHEPMQGALLFLTT